MLEKKKVPLLRKWLLTGLALSLTLLVLIFLAYTVLDFKRPYNKTNGGISNLTPSPFQKEKRQLPKIYKLEEIFAPAEKITSSQIAPNNSYAFVVIRKTTPVWHKFKENKEGPTIVVADDLIFVNLITKEKKVFDLYELAAKEIISPLKTIPGPTQYTLYVDLLKWSANNNEFWGAIDLVAGADPPVNDSVSLFKINTTNWIVERYPLPGNYINTLGPDNLNLERKAVLFESATPKNELHLYIYSLLTKSKTTVVSYPNNIFSKYLPGEYGFLGYFHPQFLKTEPRQLNGKWLDQDTIFYTDFVTRQEVTKKIE